MVTQSIQLPVSKEAVYNKVARRIIPLLFLCYIAAYLDRVNVGFAKLQMQVDVPEISDSVYGFGAGVFFLGYFLFEVPSNILMEKLGARLWIAHHDQLGDHLVGDGSGEFSMAFLRVALSARLSGGRLFPGDDPLSYLLVSVSETRSGGCAIYARAGCDRCDRRSVVGLDSSRAQRSRRIQRVADAFPLGRHSFNHRRSLYSAASVGRDQVGRVANPSRKGPFGEAPEARKRAQTKNTPGPG